MSLSDKTIKCVCGGDNDNRRILYHEKDLKEEIKNLKEKDDEAWEMFLGEVIDSSNLRHILGENKNEIFGDELSK